jgi:hypothetical protein
MQCWESVRAAKASAPAGRAGRVPRRLPREVLKEAIATLIVGEAEVGKTLLRNDVIARLGFDELGRLTGKAPQSLMRMLSRTGNPQVRTCSR